MSILRARKNLTSFCTYVFGWDVQGFQKEWHSHAENEEIKRLLIYASVEHGKSQNFSVAYPLYRIGRNQNVRGAIICNTSDQAEKFSGQIQEIIEGSSDIAIRYRKVFPQVRKPGKSGRRKHRAWGTNAFIVDRTSVSPDYTLVAIGVGKKFLGARFDFIVFDDILDFENTSTEGQREKTWRWMTSTALTRIVRNGKAIFITTAWHDEDAAHVAEASGVWYVCRTSALPVFSNGDPDWTGVSSWPEQWSIDRLRDKYEEVGSIEFARQFLCLAVSDSLSRFKEASFNVALEQGQDCTMVEQYIPTEVRPGVWINNLPVFAGMDLNVKKQRRSDDTCLFVGCIHPNSKRQILKIIKAKMDGRDILDTLSAARKDFPKLQVVYVEDNAAQDFIVQFARAEKDCPPVKGFTTTHKKYSAEIGIPSLSVELDGGLWIFPSGERKVSGRLHPEIQSLVQRLKTWTPRDHTPDNVMAMWFFREAAIDNYGLHVETGGIKRDHATGERDRFFEGRKVEQGSLHPTQRTGFFGS